MEFLVIVLALCISCALIQATFLVFGIGKPKNLPPGPTPLPIIGSLHLLSNQPHQSLANLAKTHGPIMFLKLGHITTLVISSAAAAKQVLQKQDLVFSTRHTPDALNAHNHAQNSVVWLPVAAQWRTLRRIFKSNIFSTDSLDANKHLRSKKVHELMAYCRIASESNDSVDIGRAAFRTTLNLLSNTIFTKDFTDPYEDSGNEFRKLVGNMMVEAGRPNLVDFFPVLKKMDPQGIRRRMSHYFGRVFEVFEELIQERLGKRRFKHHDDDDDDVLDVCLKISEENPDAINRKHIKAMFLINCDVCNKDEASVFCSADDAALCTACDHRVHHANILAEKHPRFSLLLPSPKDSPICDICQEKKAILFCQQDRAILCKDCDVAIHKVNEHTKNHCRFLLTGVKLSSAALLPTAGNDVVPDQNPKSRDQEPVPIVNQTSSRTQKITAVAAQNMGPKSNGSGHGSPGSSSISEYLIEMLPGWHVEDFLDSPSNFSKIDEDDPAVFWDDEVLKESMNDCFSPETMGIWVPQAPPPAAPPQQRFHNSPQIQPYSNMEFGNQIMSGSSLVFGSSNINHKMTKSTGKRRSDDGNCFTVPQINPPCKRSRTLW